jgi:PAS domain S-box-containing protein
MAEESKIGILVIEDEQEISELLKRELLFDGYKVMVSASVEAGFELIKNEKFFVALADIKASGQGNVEFVNTAKKLDPDIEVIIVSGQGTMDNAIANFRAGVFDYILKPFTVADIKQKVKRAVDRYHSRKMITLLNENVTKTYIELEKLKDSLEEKVLERTWELAESEKKYRRIIEDSFDPIITINSENQVTGWNKGAEITFGYPHEEIYGAKIETLFIVNPETVMNTLIERVKKEDGFTRNYITRCYRKNREEIDVNITANRLGDDGLCLIVRDITREKKIDKMKSDFVSNVSHELRTPLTSIKSAVDLVLSGAEGPLTEPEKSMLTIVKNNSARLIKLINELLDLSKLESGKMEMNLKPTKIDQLIKATIEETSPLMVTKHIKMEMVVQPGIEDVYIDENKIKQVLVNLIGNALKFSTEGGRITIRAADKTNEIHVSVADTGIGITKENFDKVFEKFVQVDSSTTRSAGGTGLGLAIAKSIVEAHKGRMWLESDVGKGTTFFFSLPKMKEEMLKAQCESLNKEMSALEKTNETAAQAFCVRRILVVDDDEDITMFIKESLIQQKYEVHVSNSAMDAIKKANELQPDLITLDLMMPTMDGYFITGLLKQNPKTMDIPIVIVSSGIDKEKCYRLGINDFIQKPFEPNVFLETIRRVEKNMQNEILKKKVLIVDSDPNSVSELTLAFTNRGYTVFSAYNGIQAVAITKKDKPGILVLDVELLEAGNFNIIKTIKNDSETAAIPAIIIGKTAAAKEKAMQYSANGYLIKPFTTTVLFEEIDKIFASFLKK